MGGAKKLKEKYKGHGLFSLLLSLFWLHSSMTRVFRFIHFQVLFISTVLHFSWKSVSWRLFSKKRIYFSRTLLSCHLQFVKVSVKSIFSCKGACIWESPTPKNKDMNLQNVKLLKEYFILSLLFIEKPDYSTKHKIS